MKLPLSSIALVLFCITSGTAQEESSLKNALYLEIFGSAGYIYNVTYDRTVFNRNQDHISLALGTQYFPKGEVSDERLVTLSPQVNYFRGRNRHFLELGIGYIFDLADKKDVGDKEDGISFRIGYRYQRETGLFFKAAVTPILSDSFPVFGEGNSLLLWGGIAIGYSFK